MAGVPCVDEICDGVDTDMQDDLSGVGAGPHRNWVPASVKMKLNTFCADPRLRNSIDRTVADVNAVVGEAYALADLHVTRMLESGSSLDHLRTKGGWSMFYYQCLTRVSAFNSRPGTVPKELLESARLFEELRPEGQQKIEGTPIAPVLEEVREVMATAAVNSLCMNAAKRIRRYLRWRFPHLRTYHGSIVAMVTACPQVSLDAVDRFKPMGRNGQVLSQQSIDKRKQARQLTEDLRRLCAMRYGTDKMYASSAVATLPLMRFILRETEGYLANNQCRTAARRFTLLPQKHGCTVSNIPICSRMLLRLVKDLKDRNGRPLYPMDFAISHVSKYDESVDKVWRHFFNVNAVETRTRRFDHKLVSDGCSASVLMTVHHAHVCSSTSISDAWTFAAKDPRGHEPQYVGVDPGVTDVVTVASYMVGKGVPTVKSYSSSRYYQNAKIKTSNRRTDKWNGQTTDFAESLNVNVDRSSVAGVCAAIRAFLGAFRTLLQHRIHRGYRNMRFMRHVHKQRTVNDICNFIAPPDRFSVIGFGDWKGVGDTPIKRRFCGPLQDIKRELRRRSIDTETSKKSVALGEIWEYKTSVTEHTSWTPMTNMVADSTIRKRDGHMERKNNVKVHKVLHARKGVDGVRRTETTWNRDVNAARNILMLMMMELHGFARPEAFQKSPVRRRPTRSSRRQTPRGVTATLSSGSST